jgi:ABC-2 type transport system ATP-binding protein
VTSVPAAQDDRAIRVVNLSKRFGDQVAISGLTLDIAPGEVFGLLGPNGAGKTTTLRILAGIYTPDTGQVEVAGLPHTQADAIRGRVGLLTEQPGLYDRLTVEENLRFFASLYGVPSAELAGRIARWLQPLGLWEHRSRRAGTLSKGMRQKLAIARAVIHEPPIVLLDEPTSGLDPESARTVRDAIAGLSTQGRTLVLCSHNLYEVEQLCRRVAILRPTEAGGRLVALTEVSRLRTQSNAGVDIELVGPAHEWLVVAGDVPGVRSVAARGSTLEVRYAEGAVATPVVIAKMAAAGAFILSVRPQELAFEQAYLDLMAEEGAA